MTEPKMRRPGAAKNRKDAGLHQLLAASDSMMLTAIRRRLDASGGLTQIFRDGDPPWRPASVAGAPPAGWAPGDAGSVPGTGAVWQDDPAGQELAEVASRIATVRFALLDVCRDTGTDRLCDIAAALAGGAAANLKDLNRGLDGRELTCSDALSLLDQVGLALEKARDSAQPAPPPWQVACQDAAPGRIRKRRSWLLRSLVCGPTGAALLTIAAPALTAALAAVVVPLWVASWLSAGFLVSVLVIPLVAGATFLAAVTAGWAIVARAVSRKAAAGLGLRGDPGTRFEELRAELTQIRPEVVSLFDEVDGCPAHT